MQPTQLPPDSSAIVKILDSHPNDGIETIWRRILNNLHQEADKAVELVAPSRAEISQLAAVSSDAEENKTRTGRRRISNRIAAARCRKRKSAYIESLESVLHECITELVSTRKNLEKAQQRLATFEPCVQPLQQPKYIFLQPTQSTIPIQPQQQFKTEQQVCQPLVQYTERKATPVLHPQSNALGFSQQTVPYPTMNMQQLEPYPTTVKRNCTEETRFVRTQPIATVLATDYQPMPNTFGTPTMARNVSVGNQQLFYRSSMCTSSATTTKPSTNYQTQFENM